MPDAGAAAAAEVQACFDRALLCGLDGQQWHCLLADPASVTYEALGLVKGLQQTFWAKEVSAREPQYICM